MIPDVDYRIESIAFLGTKQEKMVIVEPYRTIKQYQIFDFPRNVSKRQVSCTFEELMSIKEMSVMLVGGINEKVQGWPVTES